MRSGTVFVSLLNKTSSGGKGESRILARSRKRAEDALEAAKIGSDFRLLKYTY